MRRSELRRVVEDISGLCSGYHTHKCVVIVSHRKATIGNNRKNTQIQ